MIRLLFVVAMLFVAGCAGPVAQQDDQQGRADAGRLEVNDSLREACWGQMLTDVEIRAAIEQMEAVRLEGHSLPDAVTIIYESCVTEQCRQCWFAIADQVYGQ